MTEERDKEKEGETREWDERNIADKIQEFTYTHTPKERARQGESNKHLARIQLVCNIRYIEITLSILCYRWHDSMEMCYSSFSHSFTSLLAHNFFPGVYVCVFSLFFCVCLSVWVYSLCTESLSNFSCIRLIGVCVCIINCVAFDMILRDGYLTLGNSIHIWKRLQQNKLNELKWIQTYGSVIDRAREWVCLCNTKRTSEYEKEKKWWSKQTFSTWNRFNIINVYLYEFVRFFFWKKSDTFKNYLLEWYGGSRALENKIVFGNRFDDDKKRVECECDDINISYYVFVACNGQCDDSLHLYNISFCSINSIGNGISCTHIVYIFSSCRWCTPFLLEMLMFIDMWQHMIFSSLSSSQAYEHIFILSSWYLEQKSRQTIYNVQTGQNGAVRVCVCDENKILHQITTLLIVIKFCIACVTCHILFSNGCAQ